MATIQKYGIKYPFENKNVDGLYVDLNEDRKDELKSQVLHVLFTPKGQRMRDPDFGTELTKYLWNPNDDINSEEVVKSISKDLKKYVPAVNLDKITVMNDEENENSKVLVIHYSVRNGNTIEHTSAAVKI